MSTVLFESDWLASEPVFYNERTGAASRNINDVIDLLELAFDPEGLRNYLDFGYSVFQQTPIAGVKYLPPSARLLRQDSGEIVVRSHDDRLNEYLSARLSETDVLDLVESRVRQWEGDTSGDIVIPTSGGYDSRLLNVLVRDKGRVRAFTYGVSPVQSESYEVACARETSARLGTRWRQVELGEFHRHFDAWDDLFGVSMHAHGMYHIEFYTKILAYLETPRLLLSGACGDWFAGADFVNRYGSSFAIRGPDDIPRLIITKSMHADSAACCLPGSSASFESYYDEHCEDLDDPARCVVEGVRFRIMLLSYLLRVPRSLGFDARSPFLDIDIATAMLGLPAERRLGRAWQRDFFASQGLDLDGCGGAWRNTLNAQAMRRVPLRPLDAGLLREVVRPEYVRWINRGVRRLVGARDAYETLRHTRGLRRIMSVPHRLGVRDQRREAYCAYLTLRPLENLLRRRDAARAGAAR